MSGKIDKPATVKLSSVAPVAKSPPKSPPKSAPKMSIVAAADATEPGPDKAHVVKLKTLLDAVVTKTGAKKKDAKEVVDAALAEIAAALGQGHSLSLPPLGNLRVVKTQAKGGAQTMVLRLRTGKEGVAPDNDDS